MALIEFENKPSTNTPINADNLNHNFNEVNVKDYIIATINARQNVDSHSKVLLNSVYHNEGNSFSLNTNGEIVIGADVSYIEISANIYYENLQSGSYAWTQIYKNDVFETGAICPSTYYAGASIPSIIIPVNEGDIISLYADSPSGGQIPAGKEHTFIQIKKVI